MPAVSVLMCVYNGGPWLERSARSILAQTFSDLEFVIIDDGSTDGSEDVLRALAAEDGRIKLVRQTNTGLTRALNVGLELCSGGLVARQDADDYSAPQRLERQVAFMTAHPDVVLLGTDYVLVDDDNRAITTIRNSGKKDLRKAVGKSNPFVHGAMMFRREIAGKQVLYDEYYRKGQDYDLALRLSELGEVAILAEPLYEWRHSRFGILATNVTIYGDRARENFLRRKAGQPEVRDDIPAELLKAKPSNAAFELSLAQRFVSAYELDKARGLLVECLTKGHLEARHLKAWLRLFVISLLPVGLVRHLRER